MLNVKCEIQTYDPVNNEGRPVIQIKSDTKYSSQVILVINEKEYTVIAEDLINAVHNARNC